MTQSIILVVFLLLSLLAANLPWLTERRLFVLPPLEGGKPWPYRLLEWLIMYAVAIGAGLLLEQKATGQTHAQDWEFYAITACLFMVLALPGVIAQLRR